MNARARASHWKMQQHLASPPCQLHEVRILSQNVCASNSQYVFSPTTLLCVHGGQQYQCLPHSSRNRQSNTVNACQFETVVVLSEGQNSCATTYRSESRARQKSHDKKVATPTKLSVDSNSVQLPSSYGPSTPPQSSRPSRDAMCALLNDGCRGNFRRPMRSSRRSCTRLSSEIEFHTRHCSALHFIKMFHRDASQTSARRDQSSQASRSPFTVRNTRHCAAEIAASLGAVVALGPDQHLVPAELRSVPMPAVRLADDRRPSPRQRNHIDHA